MRRTMALAATALVALAFAAVASSQTGDTHPDGTTHPYVGALLRARTDGSLTITCSGTLVSPRVFLTAGHCSDYLFSLGQSTAYVTFNPNFGTDADHNIFTTPYHGTVIENPDWHKPYQNDTAIVLLDQPVEGITPQPIAPLGLLDGLKDAHALDSQSYLNVGYGTSEKVVVKGSGPDFPFDGTRKWTISGYHALDSEYIHLDQSLARGLSGTGYGDSGGPTFLTVNGTQYVISVVSTGDVPCYSTSVNERVDTQNAHAFLDPYLVLN